MNPEPLDTTSPTSEPRRVLSFTGTLSEFYDYLDAFRWTTANLGGTGDDAFEWDLTASVARHPAGKGLGR